MTEHGAGCVDPAMRERVQPTTRSRLTGVVLAVVGEGEALLHAPDLPLGVVISYEVFFADRVAEGIGAVGEVVLAPTNASSYVTDAVPAIELAATRLRAREFGRVVLLAAPTGYSAIVRPDGDVTAVSELGEQVLLRDDVPLQSGTTPYARLGDVPPIVLAVIVLVLAPVTAAARRRWSPAAATQISRNSGSVIQGG